MSLKAPPKEKIKLFDDIEVHGKYVGVLRPEEEDESDIEIPESAEREKSLEGTTARVARVGSEVDHIEPGDKVLVSLFMNRPHQSVGREDDEGNDYHMFIIDGNMVVGTVHDQKEAVDDMFG